MGTPIRGTAARPATPPMTSRFVTGGHLVPGLRELLPAGFGPDRRRADPYLRGRRRETCPAKLATVGKRERLGAPDLRQDADDLERPPGEGELCVAVQLDPSARAEHAEQQGLRGFLYAAQPDSVTVLADDSERLGERSTTLENGLIRFCDELAESLAVVPQSPQPVIIDMLFCHFRRDTAEQALPRPALRSSPLCSSAHFSWSGGHRIIWLSLALAWRARGRVDWDASIPATSLRLPKFFTVYVG